MPSSKHGYAPETDRSQKNPGHEQGNGLCDEKHVGRGDGPQCVCQSYRGGKANDLHQNGGGANSA